MLYDTLILPYLNYCNIVWAATYPTRLQKLVILQKRAIRVITGSDGLAHTSPLFKSLNLLKVPDINVLQTALFVFSSKHDLLPQACSGYFIHNLDIHQHYTRSCSKYHFSCVSTNIRKYSIRYNGPLIWNSIPESIKASVSTVVFKKTVKHYLIDKY